MSVSDARDWATVGTGLLLDTVDRLDDSALAGPSVLPGWSRAHVLAHLACNAEALARLVHWARTGEERPMYASTEQRNRDIEHGSTLPARELRAWVRNCADVLAGDLDTLSDAAWKAQVRTSQGRLVPASEIPWMRAQEVFVHAVDLDGGTGFTDMPPDFLGALIDKVTTRRSTKADGPALAVHAEDTDRWWQVAGAGEPVPVSASSAVLAQWLTGRPVEPAPGPPLPAWL